MVFALFFYALRRLAAQGQGEGVVGDLGADEDPADEVFSLVGGEGLEDLVEVGESLADCGVVHGVPADILDVDLDLGEGGLELVALGGEGVQLLCEMPGQFASTMRYRADSGSFD